jgi:hypothetical protein
MRVHSRLDDEAATTWESAVVMGGVLSFLDLELLEILSPSAECPDALLLTLPPLARDELLPRM